MNEQVIQVGGESYKQCEIIMLATEKAQLNALCLTASSKLILLDGKDWETVNDVAGFRPQHLYILSSEEIKEGDWFLTDDRDRKTDNFGNPNWKLCKCTKIKNGWIFCNEISYVGHNPDWSKKIIATTNFSLTHIVDWDKNAKDIMISVGDNPKDYQNYKSLPRPSDDFIKAFVEKQGKIDKVLVEYQAYHGIKTSIAEVNAISGDDSMNWQGRNDLRDYKIKVSPDNTITIKPIQEEKTSWSREEVEQKCRKAFQDGYQYIAVSPKYMEKDTNEWIEENL